MMAAQEINLNHLPNKVRMPFEGLLSRGLIDAIDLNLVLRAGRLSNKPNLLLGFAIAYMHLKGKHVPVGDTINMAEQLGLKVDLGWSARKWGEKHNLFSRALTLKTLSAEKTRYDVSEYAALLPKTWPGYLIQSSQRLGMEGLRQRHCVASYDSRIQAGYCAIAVVFLEHQRWTVELVKSRHPYDLRISQIKTKLNKSANAAQRAKIHDLLRLEEVKDSYEHQAQESGETARERLALLLPQLSEHNIKSVNVWFSGSSDEGHIESVDFDPPIKKDKLFTVEAQTTQGYYHSSGWAETNQSVEITVDNAIEEYAYTYIQSVGVDWYNDDGGDGQLTIDVETETIRLSIDVNYSNSENAHLSLVDMASGQELEV